MEIFLSFVACGKKVIFNNFQVQDLIINEFLMMIL